MMTPEIMDEAEFAREFGFLVDTYRDRCLWFFADPCRPEDPLARLRVLEAIERYGDREAFCRARRLKRWLSQNSSAPSALS